ncbi:hypothetical protein PRN20_03490 [Devosia sp. ZB163]|uniref:hypothetical protein n=1 Tax=Devosia sp. ZB163 TaxID=3025938 RepID=UPI00235FAAC7|nr:hypothetical protein [Devosia sp. ZB163]MDC9822785.1 hypothetical protein [Devosia sp. ZB163]
MVAGLLYLVGLIATLVTIVMVGASAPAIVQNVSAVLAAADPDYIGLLVDTARSLNWALAPFVGGLVLMALARIVMLLGSIDRALRGSA